MNKSKNDLRVIYSSQDCKLCSHATSKQVLKWYMFQEQYTQNQAICKLKTLKFTLLCKKNQSFLVFHFSQDSANLVLRPHPSRKYYIYSTCYKNSTSETSKTAVCNSSNTIEHTWAELNPPLEISNTACHWTSIHMVKESHKTFADLWLENNLAKRIFSL